MNKTLLTSPKNNLGGVATFVNNIFPCFSMEVEKFYRGKNPNIKSIYIEKLLTVLNPILFLIRVIQVKPKFVIVNTSLTFNCIIRDGFMVFISKVLKKKVLLIVHGYEEKAIKYDKLIRYGYFKADAITVLSEKFKRQLLKEGYNKKIYTLYNPVSREIIQNSNRNICEEKLRNVNHILFMARVEKAKGIYTAIESFNIIKQEIPDIILHIAGTGKEFENIKDEIAKNKTEDIILHGFVTGNEKLRLLQKADAFIFPTVHKEGLPISVLEAMATGQLIISRPVGGLKDLFEMHSFGICTDSTDPKDFASSFLEKKDAKDYLLEVRKSNMKFSRENFDPGLVAKEIEKILITDLN